MLLHVYVHGTCNRAHYVGRDHYIMGSIALGTVPYVIGGIVMGTVPYIMGGIVLGTVPYAMGGITHHIIVPHCDGHIVHLRYIGG